MIAIKPRTTLFAPRVAAIVSPETNIRGYCWLAFALLLGLAAAQTLRAQLGIDSSSVGNVHVHVVYPNDRAAGMHLRVQLMSGSAGTPVAESFTNDQGVTEFTRVPVGEYHVVVTGEEVEGADSGQFEVDRRKVSQDLYITVRRKEPNGTPSADGPASIAAVDLNVPEPARKEFDKATKAMADQNWSKAQQQLLRAISLYPQYAPAYNNLAVVYGHTNDAVHEREALEKAISLNDHFVPAYVNLAKLCLKERNSAQAQALLESADRVGPGNAETLTLLAEAQLLNNHYDAAVKTARLVHGSPHQHFAVVHYIAARALEHEDRLQEALAELKIFLTEEPQGPRADHVRDEINRLEQQVKP